MSKDSPALGLDTAPNWDVLWADANLPDGTAEAWRAVFADRTRVPDEAEHLAAHGWTPQDVLDARANPRVLLAPSEHLDLTRFTGASALTQALAVLAQEVANYHAARADLARSVVTDLAIDLYAGKAASLGRRRPAEGTGPEAQGDALVAGDSFEPWTFDRIGALIGVSKQRARAIVRHRERGARGIISTRGTSPSR